MTARHTPPSEAHRAARRATFEIEHEIVDRLSSVAQRTLGKYGSWLSALMEGELLAETPQQQRFITLMERSGSGDTDFERAWKEYAPLRCSLGLEHYIEIYHGGGEGYAFLSDAIWVPSGSAANERYGFALSKGDKEFFLHDLEEMLGSDFESQQSILVRDPQSLFGKLLHIGRREGTSGASGEVDALILDHEVGYIAIFSDDEPSKAEAVLSKPGVIEKYLDQTGLACTYVEDLRDIFEIMYEWQPEYVVPLEGVSEFLEGILQIMDLAGSYGRSRVRVIEQERTKRLSRQADVSIRQADEDYQQQLGDELEDHWRDQAQQRIAYDESEVFQRPDYDPDDLETWAISRMHTARRIRPNHDAVRID